MIIKEARFEDILDELRPMFKTHWEELGEVGTSGVYDLDEDSIIKLSEMGMYRCFVAEHLGSIIGYLTCVISRGIHVRDLYAVTDAVYVDKEYRKGLLPVGIKLIKYAEFELKTKYKVNVMQFAMNTTYDISGLLERMNYKAAQINYNKYLGE